MRLCWLRTVQPTTLSTALWRPTSSFTTTLRPSAVNRPAACRPPVRLNVGWASRSRSGQASYDVDRHLDRVDRVVLALGEFVEALLAADTARGRRDAVPLGWFAVRRAVEGDRDGVELLLPGQLHVGAVGNGPDRVRPDREPLAEAEPGRQLEVGTRRPHRHHQRLGRPARPLQPQLERLLGDDDVLTPRRPLAVQHLDLEPGGGTFASYLHGRRSPAAAYGEPVEEGPGVEPLMLPERRRTPERWRRVGVPHHVRRDHAARSSRGVRPVRRPSAGCCGSRRAVSMPWC